MTISDGIKYNKCLSLFLKAILGSEINRVILSPCLLIGGNFFCEFLRFLEPAQTHSKEEYINTSKVKVWPKNTVAVCG